MNGYDDFYRQHEANELEGSIALNGVKLDAVLAKLSKGLEGGWSETEVQDFLKERPSLFLGRGRLGHGSWAFPELEFGGRYRPDWLIGEGSSAGVFWEVIELKSPQITPFKKNGELGRYAQEGIQQIQRLRSFISSQRALVHSPKYAGGMGLRDLNCRVHGTVVIGLRKRYEVELGKSEYDRVRRQCYEQNCIRLKSYETLIDEFRFQMRTRSSA